MILRKRPELILLNGHPYHENTVNIVHKVHYIKV